MEQAGKLSQRSKSMTVLWAQMYWMQVNRHMLAGLGVVFSC